MKKIISKALRAFGFAFLACSVFSFASCADSGSSDDDSTEENNNNGGGSSDNSGGGGSESDSYSLCMVNTSFTEDQTLTSSTTFSNFGKDAYLIYQVPVTSSSNIEMTAHVKFSDVSAQNGGIGFIELSGTKAVSTSIGYASGVGVKNATSGGTLLYTGGNGYSITTAATTDTEYVAHIKISSGKWTITYRNSTDKTTLWTKNNSWSTWYEDTSTVYLAIGGADTSSVTYWNVKVTDLSSDTDHAITSLKYNALAGLSLTDGDEEISAITLSSDTTKEITVTSTDSGSACAWTASSDNTSVVTVSPASGSASDTTLTLTPVSLGQATVTVTNSANTSLTKTITVTVADYPKTNSEYSLTSTNIYPAAGATDAYDNGYLRLTFDGNITLSDGGFVTIWKHTDSGDEQVDKINFIDETQTASSTKINVGSQLTRVDGANLYITPHFDVLEANTTYYIAIPEGVITTDSANPKINSVEFTGLSSSYDSTNGWYFTTRSAPSISVGTEISVDGSESNTADFRSIQKVLSTVQGDSTLNSSSNTFTVNVAAGTYYEFIYYKGKANFKIAGQGSSNYGIDTVIEYINCNDMNGSTHTRAVFYYGGGSDLWLTNLSIKNLTERDTQYISTVTPSKNSQAEAIFFANGNSSYKAAATLAVNNCTFYSHQDTIQTSGKNWFYKCDISGDVDFLWGTAEACLFEKCTLTNLAYSQATSMIVSRCVEGGKSTLTDLGKGYVVKDCTIKIEDGGTAYLGRDTQSEGSTLTWYDQAAVINSTVSGGTLGSTLWNEDCEVGYTTTADTYNTTMPIGWKDYGNTYSITPTRTKSCTMAENTYTNEYSTRALILDRLINVSTSEYSDATTSKWDTISTWSLSDLVSAFGISE